MKDGSGQIENRAKTWLRFAFRAGSHRRRRRRAVSPRARGARLRERLANGGDSVGRPNCSTASCAAGVRSTSSTEGKFAQTRGLRETRHLNTRTGTG